MRFENSVSVVVIGLGAALTLGACGGSRHCEHGAESAAAAPDLLDPNPAPATIQVTLPSLTEGHVPAESVFSGFGCTGGNRSLAVSWTAGPDRTQSYALIVHDPDAPTGVGFFHWTVFDIPRATTSLALDASAHGMPAGAIQAHTDFGSTGYGGPCPPPGPAHRYIVTVYALDVPALGADASLTGATLRFMLRQHSVAIGRATATYARP